MLLVIITIIIEPVVIIIVITSSGITTKITMIVKLDMWSRTYFGSVLLHGYFDHFSDYIYIAALNITVLPEGFKRDKVLSNYACGLGKQLCYSTL